MHKLRILKLVKDFKMYFLYMAALKKNEWKALTVNTTFKQVETNQFYNTRSFNTHQQLKKQDSKTEKYGRFYSLAILSKQMCIWLEPTPSKMI